MGVEPLQALLVSTPVVPAALVAALLGLLILAVYRVRAAPEIAENKVADLIRDLDAKTQALNEAEKIGKFGSFTWDFQNANSSYWSDEMYDIFGLVKRRVPPGPESFVSSAQEGDKPTVSEAWKLAQSRPGSFSFIFRAVAPDKSARSVRVQGNTTLAPDKTLARIHGVVHDISRDVEIDKAKTEFVSLASHQLKTPLTSIRWLVEAMLSGSLGPLNPAQQKYAINMQQSTQRLIDMVNDLLTASRIELNKLARQIEELDAVQMAQNVINEQMHDAEARSIVLSFTAAKDIPHIFADKISLRMVFQNLISNAIKYTPEKGTITCDLSLGGVTKDSLFLTVSDTGIGIPQKEHDRVFEKLHRASNAQALVPDGTGLGLYVVKTVLDKAGGNITFESTEGKGTTFYATIPIRWPQLDSAQTPQGV